MTREQLVELVEHWRRRLCPEWQVIVSFEEPEREPEGHDDDWVACVADKPEISEIAIWFRPAVFDNDDDGIARIVVHELIHPLLDRVLDHDDALQPYCGAVQWEVFREQRREAMEEFVNRMAHVIVDGGARTGTREGTPKVGWERHGT